MKFESFSKIRQTLKESGVLNESVVSFRDYKKSFEAAAIHAEAMESIINKEMDDLEFRIACYESMKLQEKSGEKNWLQIVIGYMQIKSMAAKYVKAMVDEGINDMDYYRRRAASKKGGHSGEETEQLKIAHKTKADALADRVKAIAERMDTIAGGSDFLKTATSKAKTQGRIKKNEILIKIASKEEAKELKLKNAELTKDIATKDNELREYEQDNKEEIENAMKEAKDKAQKKIDEIKDQIDQIQDRITELDTELDPKDDPAKAAKAHTEMANQKKKKIELLSQLATAEQTFNQAGQKEEYDPERHKETAVKLQKEIKDHEEKAAEYSKKGEETPAKAEKGEGEGEGEKEPASKPAEKGEGEGEKEPASKPAEKGEETEQQKKEKAYKKQKIQDKLEGAKKSLEKAKEDGKSEDAIKNIQKNIDDLQAQLDKMNDSTANYYDYMYSLVEIEESVDNILEMIENLSSPKSKPGFVTFTDFVSRR